MNISEITKEVQKSSRDVVIVVKEHKQKLKQSSQGGSLNARDDEDQQKEVDSIGSPVNVTAYELFNNGLTPLEVASELKLSEADTTIGIKILPFSFNGQPTIGIKINTGVAGSSITNSYYIPKFLYT